MTKPVAGMAPNDYVEPMRDRLQTESNNLMLVGHLPYLSRLVAMLLGVRKDHTVVVCSAETSYNIKRHTFPAGIHDANRPRCPEL